MLASMRRFKAGVFQALAHPTRVALVDYLKYGELSVGQLCEKVGIEQANAVPAQKLTHKATIPSFPMLPQDPARGDQSRDQWMIFQRGLLMN